MQKVLWNSSDMSQPVLWRNHVRWKDLGLLTPKAQHLASVVSQAGMVPPSEVVQKGTSM